MSGLAEQAFTTRTVSPPHRIDEWRSALGLLADVRALEVEDPSTFSASMEYHKLPDGMLLCNMSAGCSTIAHRFHKTESRPGGINATIWLSGLAKAIQHNRCVDIGPGSIILRSEGDESELVISKPVRSISLSISYKDIEKLKIPSQVQEDLPCKIDNSLPLGSALEGMLRGVSFNLNRLGDQAAQESLEKSLLYMLGASWQGASTLHKSNDLSDNRKWQEFERLIESRLGDSELNISVVATEMNRSVRWLQKLLARRGLRYENYVMQRRLDQARNLLALGDGRQIIDICMDCGFEDPSHFSRSFRNRFNTSPSSFQRRFYK